MNKVDTERTTRGISTNQLAAAIGGKPESIRVRLCKTGSYYGLRPRKLPSGRLLWPEDAVDRLLRQHDGNWEAA